MPITKKNHFIPKFYLKQWCNDSNQIWCYNLLRLNKNVPKWSEKYVKGIAYKNHLYTYLDSGVETSEFEHWLDNEIETPASLALNTLVTSGSISHSQLKSLVRFMIIQQLRTPSYYIDLYYRSKWHIPKLFEEYNSRLPEYITSIVENHNENNNNHDVIKGPARDNINVSIVDNEQNDDNINVNLEFTQNRKLWIRLIRHFYEKFSDTISNNNWSIIRAPKDLY